MLNLAFKLANPACNANYIFYEIINCKGITHNKIYM